MKLVLTSGEDVQVGRSYPIVAGVHAKSKESNMMLVQKILAPSEQNPQGLILTNISADGMPSRQEYFPSVIGAQWQEEQQTQAAESAQQTGEAA